MTEEETKKPTGNRKLTIDIPDEIFVDFALKLQHEGIKIRRFYKFITDGYVKGDKRITSFINDEMKNIRQKYKTRLLERENKRIELEKKKFGLDPDEIDDMFDLIEKETEI